MPERVLITGAARGLGAQIASDLSQNGYNLLLHYLTSEEEIQKVAAHCKKNGANVELIQGELMEIEDVACDHLINNVGVYTNRSLLDYSIEEYRETFEVNCFAPLMLIKRNLKRLKSVINLGVSGLSKKDRQCSLYRLTKRTLLHITEMAAKELAEDQIRVNMISPGQLTHSVDLPEDLRKLPMGRAVLPQEVCQAVLFFLQSPSVTGQNLEVAGGLGL